MFERWRNAMERGGRKVNVNKTKLLLSDKPLSTRRETGRHPCGVCGAGVSINSILCTQCHKWVYERCSGLATFASVQDFRCSTCVQQLRPISKDTMEIDDDTI